MANNSESPRPAHKVIRIGVDGIPWIAAYRCDDCGAVVPDATLACRACASRNPVQEFRSALSGKLHSWSIVHRSYPGVTVPFVSAIVDLDDGLAIKGTLSDAEAGMLMQGARVTIAFDDAGGATDPDGHPYIGFHFALEGAAA